jgi:hypothetical protein
LIISRAALDGPVAAAAAGLLRGWRVRMWVAASVAFGIVMSLYPLVGVLGFELALFTSALATLIGVDLGGALVRRAQTAPPLPLAGPASPLRVVGDLWLRAAGIAAAVAVVPGVIAAIHGIWAPTCDWWFGIQTYLAMPLASAVLFAGLGVAVALVTGPRGVFARVAPLLAVLVLAGWGLWRFYAAPPVFSYNPIIGYFPGNLYDEHVQLSMPLFWARLETLAWVVGLLALAAARLDAPRFRVGVREVRPRGMRASAWITAVVGLTAAVVLRLASGRLGHGIDADDISRELAGRIETAHFVIDYARTPDIERELPIIVADHEFRYAQIVARTGIAVDGKIHSYYFANNDQKARWMGGRTVDMAKPWRREIYIDHRGFPHGSLRHEIAHVVAGEFGDAIFAVSARSFLGIPIPIPGLIEGYAVAVDWPGGYDRSITPHQAMRVLQAMDQQPDVGQLLSLKFLTFSSAQSYTTAGSFLRFLLDRYGARPARVLYESGGDFAAAYNRSQHTLVQEWRAFIATQTIPPEAIEANRERFGRGSVFDRPCPHATAERRQRAGRLADEGDRSGAIKLMREVCREQPDEPRHRLDLSYMLLGGTASEKAEALATWRALSGRDGGSNSVRVEALLGIATEAADRGDWTEVWDRTLEVLTLYVDDGHRRQALARFIGLSHPGPASPFLRGYFFGTEAGTGRYLAAMAVAVEPTLGLAHYLFALRALEDGEDALGARELVIALDRGLPGPLFVRNAARRLAVAAYRARDRAGVERAIQALTTSAGMTEIDRLLAVDWQERLAFDATGTLPTSR